MAVFRHSPVEEVGGIARCSQLPLKPKSQKTGILLGSLGVSVNGIARRARSNLSTGYPQLNVDNCGVWEF